MHRTLMAGFLAAGVVAVTLGGLPKRSADASHIALEQDRLRAHFDSVLVELRARDVADLTLIQRAARSQLTTWLAEYRDGGRFPLNDRYSDSRTPIFRDARGVTCAMAYLIERSGRRDIVDRVATTRNLAYVGELVDDPALVAWLDSVGFDVREAARVQPAYGTPESGHDVDRGYAVGSMVVSGASLATATWNIVEPNRAIGVVGMITGSFTMLAGLAAMNAGSTEGDRAVGAVNLLTGGAAILAGIYALSRRRPPASAAIPGPEPRGASWGMKLDPVLGTTRGARSVRLSLTGRF